MVWIWDDMNGRQLYNEMSAEKEMEKEIEVLS